MSKKQAKPKVNGLFADGNIFAICGRAGAALRDAGRQDDVKEMYSRIMKTGSYDEAVSVVLEYVRP